MRGFSIAIAVIIVVLIVGAFSYDPIREARASAKIRKLAGQLPAGATRTSFRVGCFGPCTFGEFFDQVDGDLLASYPGGTNVTTLTHAVRDDLTAHGWIVTEWNDPQFWHADGTTSGGSVRVTGADGIAVCFIGQDADIIAEVAVDCSEERV